MKYLLLLLLLVMPNANAAVKPPVPTGLSASLSGSTINTSWNAVSGATFYKIRQNLNGSWHSPISSNALSASFPVTQSNSTYQYQVQACNSAGCSAWSGTSAGVTISISSPSGLSASLSGTTINTGWNAVSGVTSYNIRQSVNGSWQSAISTGSTRAHGFSVTGGNTYQYQVQACIGGGCSSWSSPTTNITVAALPAVPTGLSASLSGTTINTVWNVASGATSYNIRQNLNGNWQSAIGTGSARSYSFTVTGGNTYQYQVQACNSTGCSAWSGASASIAVPAAPAVPTGLSASLSSSIINTSWNAASGATSYNIRQNLNGTWHSPVNTGSARSHSFPVTQTNSTYQYQVRACNSTGCSAWSGTSPGITVPAVPGAPGGLTASLSGTTINTSWNVASGATSYNIRQSINGNWQSAIGTGSARSYSFTVTGGNTYQYQVQACNSTGCSAWSGASAGIAVPAAPAVPTGLSASLSSSIINTSWNAASGATSYNIRQNLNGTWHSPVNTGSARSHSFPVTQTNSTYQYQVRACNSTGCSAWSGTSASITVSLDPPAGLSASLSGTTINAGWNAVSGATSYNIRQSVNGNWQSAIGTSSARSYSFTVTGGNTYQYQVQACNSAGCSAWSGASAGIAVPATPAVPTGLSASLLGSTIDIGWNEVSGATSYNIRQSDNGNWQSAIGTGSARSYSFTVTGGNTYQYQVQACNSTGCSAWSGASAGIAVPLDPPAGLSASLSGTTINAGWNAVSGATSYNIRQSINGSWQSEISTGSSRTHSFTVTSGNTYQYQVQACNDSGCSNWSSAVSASTSSGRVMYIHTDVLGSVIAESDEAGTVKQVTEYKPFGKREE